MPYSQYNRQTTEDYPVTSPYFSEVYGSLRSRPEDFTSQSRCIDGNIECLTDSREVDLNDPMTVDMAMSSDFPRVRKYSAHPLRRQREEYFPEVLWDINRLRQTHQQPADKRGQDEPQADLERMPEADVPSKRTRLEPKET